MRNVIARACRWIEKAALHSCNHMSSFESTKLICNLQWVGYILLLGMCMWKVQTCPRCAQASRRLDQQAQQTAIAKAHLFIWQRLTAALLAIEKVGAFVKSHVKVHPSHAVLDVLPMVS